MPSSHDACTVDGGHRAVIFDRFRGVLPDVKGEGTHLRIPFIQVSLDSLWYLDVSIIVQHHSIPKYTASALVLVCYRV